VSDGWNEAGGPSPATYVGDIYEKSGPGVVTKYYLFNGRRVAMRQGGTLSYLCSDHLGSTTLMLNTSGGVVSNEKFYGYGLTQSGGTGTDKKYTGHQKEGDLYEMNARWYDPSTARFIQPDSIVPEPGNPQSLNRYSYVMNNPMRYTDPTGHELVDQWQYCFVLGCGEDENGQPRRSQPPAEDIGGGGGGGGGSGGGHCTGSPLPDACAQYVCYTHYCGPTGYCMFEPLPPMCYVAICANNPAACGYPSGTSEMGHAIGRSSLTVSSLELRFCDKFHQVKFWEGFGRAADCVQAGAISAKATAIARFFPGTEGEKNAIQHCYWAGSLAREQGVDFTLELLIAHEAGHFFGPGDRARDIWNNTYSIGFVAAAPGSVMANCSAALNRGDLVSSLDDPRIRSQ
jgi:RHS repeat-associated protein